MRYIFSAQHALSVSIPKDLTKDYPTEEELLKEWDFGSRKELEDDIAARLRDLEPYANLIIGIFKTNIDEWVAERIKSRGYRFVAKIEKPPGSRLTKSPQRIVDKIIESHKNEGSTKYDPENFLTTMSDVVRFRIKCNYLDDVQYFKEKIDELFKNDYEKIAIEDAKDYISTPYPDRRVGHRAIQYTFRYSDDENPFLFEVQIMTPLQHAWDKKDHHLIYEYVREGRGNEIPVHLKNRVAAMSELLYVADTVFDELRSSINEILEEE